MDAMCFAKRHTIHNGARHTKFWQSFIVVGVKLLSYWQKKTTHTTKKCDITVVTFYYSYLKMGNKLTSSE